MNFEEKAYSSDDRIVCKNCDASLTDITNTGGNVISYKCFSNVSNVFFLHEQYGHCAFMVYELVVRKYRLALRICG